MFFFPKLFCNFCAIFLAKSEWKGEKSEICGWLDPGAQSLRGNRLFWSYLIFMNNFPDISSAPWSCPLFHCYTMMSWRGSDEDQTGPRLRILSLSLSLQPVRKHGRQPSIALSLQSNLHKTAACALMMFGFVSLRCERNRCHSLSENARLSQKERKRLFGSATASDAFHYLLSKSQVFSTCYLPKVALFQSSIVRLMEARWH